MRLHLDSPAQIKGIRTIETNNGNAPLLVIDAVEPNGQYPTQFEAVVGADKLTEEQKAALRDEPAGKWIFFTGTINSSPRTQGQGYFYNVVLFGPTLKVLPADAVQVTQPQASSQPASF